MALPKTVMARANCHGNPLNCKGNLGNYHGSAQNCHGAGELSWQSAQL
ncbi:hypothetical protein MKY41_10775 [Sporosarcina sp. FSL W7-1349]